MSEPIEAFLNRLHHPMLAQIDLSLDRMHRLLAMLGNPHKRLPPVLHVAGTNGKGSLLANLKAILEAANYKVHRYTSPHLVRFRERIVLSGKEIDNAYLESIVRHIAPIVQQQPVTFFEATTAIAFLAFAEKPADILLLETGMGGRLDATNVIDKPLLNAITPIAFDHTEFLGNTLSKIAAEKAGILRGGIGCVVGSQSPEALATIEEKAKAIGAPLYRMGHEWSQHNGLYQSARRTLHFTPALAGDYQYDNAASAIACIDQMASFSITDQHISEGLAKVVWPARLQPLPSPAPDIELWLDGGHNPQGGEMLAGWLSTQKHKEIHLICGMVKGKDAKAFLHSAAPYVKSLQAITIPDEPNSLPAAQLATVASGLGMVADAAPSLEKALQNIISHAKTPAIICICGSLYLAGKVLAKMEKP